MANDKYCRECQSVIDYEYSLRLSQPFSAHQNTECVSTITQNTQAKMSTSNGRPKINKKRALPEELIKQLAGEGLGCKKIAARLQVECDIQVSYKTIQRILSGERIMA